jgi:hypothetical protein
MMIKCEICEREFMALGNLSGHVTCCHEITKEEYYLKYINPEKGKCKTCGKDTKFKNLKDGYSKFCSIRCSKIYPDNIIKCENTCLKKWGVKNPSQNTEIKNKKKETNLQNSGYENPLQNPETREKSINTCIKKFNCKNPSQNKEVKNKKIKTSIKNWNTKHPMQNPDVRERSKQTCLENSGYENPSQNPENKEKRKETCLKNHGVEWPMQSPDVRERSKQTNFEKTGYEYSSQNPEVKERSKQTNFEKTGYGNPMQNPETREKSMNTCLENSGYRNPSQNPENKEKKKETCLKNHGVRYPYQNPEIKNKGEETCLKNHGVRYASQNKEISKKQQESKLKNNNGIHPSKLTYQQCLERYPDVVKIEELIEGPNGEIWGHCKNSSCKNSEKNGGYFDVSKYIRDRNLGINSHDTNHFYCCEECKHSCPLYGRSAPRLHNLLNENKEILYTQEEYNTWKEEVYYRQKVENNTEINFCEYCHATENLHVHHEVPQKIVPGYALDPDNGIIACEKCHYEKGHATGTECSTGNLANKICK